VVLRSLFRPFIILNVTVDVALRRCEPSLIATSLLPSVKVCINHGRCLCLKVWAHPQEAGVHVGDAAKTQAV